MKLYVPRFDFYDSDEETVLACFRQGRYFYKTLASAKKHFPYEEYIEVDISVAKIIKGC